MDKAYKTIKGEKDARKAFNKYVMEREQMYGPLMKRVNKVDKVCKTLANLESEAEEIPEKGNIITYKKQTTVQDNNTLSAEHVERVNEELENQKLSGCIFTLEA